MLVNMFQIKQYHILEGSISLALKSYIVNGQISYISHNGYQKTTTNIHEKYNKVIHT
jgi:hypothetical protein